MHLNPSDCGQCEIIYFTDRVFQMESAFLQCNLDKKADTDVLVACFVKYIDERLKEVHKTHG